MAERVDDGAGLAADDLPLVRPPVDRVRMAATRARAEQSLFGSAEPAKIGRYVLLGGQTDGGMGVVYAAYDPDLHRKVALKVLHPRRQSDDGAHERLIAEGRALARLDHPNVVKVHDVISQDGHVVIVMEWIEGTTLAAWEHAARSWRDIVAIYVQAGHGLAAAHGVGVVHRDFKPANAIVGSDNRVRVLDFGLARAAVADSAPTAPGQPTAARDPTASGGPTAARDPTAPTLTDLLASGSGDHGWAADVTATGDMVGTIGYAAPEQLAGESAVPASDQFSFGVALHRALEGVPPFPGDNAIDLLASIRTERIALAADARPLPAWLRSAVRRTLSATPSARFPSMTALLGELARPRGWRRWRIPLVVSACALVAAIAVLTRPGASDPLAGCDGGAAQIAAVWSPIARARVQASLDAIATPIARDARDRVLHGIDDYRDRWTVLHRDACVAHRRGEQSAALLDRRMLCMQRRLGDLRASVAIVQQLGAASVARATDVVARMPSVADCSDLERLEADTEPPSTPAQRTAVDAVRVRLSQAAALDRAGRSNEALAAATLAFGDAEHASYPPVVAEAALLRGRILMSQRDLTPAAASEALGYARTVALEQRLFAVAVEAAARKIYIDGMQSSDLPAAEREAAVFLPLSQGLAGDHFARPLLLNNLGNVALAAQDHAQAVHYFQAAHDALATIAAPDLELTVIDQNLSMVTEDPRRREALARGAWERFHAALGEANLSTLEALEVYARGMTDPPDALSRLRRACAGYDQFHPDMVGQRVYCRNYCAFLANSMGDRALALRIYEEMAAIADGSNDADIAAWGRLASGYAHFLRGDADRAAAAWKPIVAVLGDSPTWWVRLPATHARLGLGLSAHAQGREHDATSYLEAAIADYREAAALNCETEHQLRLTMAERALSEARTAIPTR